MRVISFGVYSKRPEYPRHRNLLEGLRRAGVEVAECHVPLDQGFRARFRSASTPAGALGFGFRLLSSFVRLTLRFRTLARADAILVGYPALFHAHLARWLGGRWSRPPRIVVDVFAPVYETVVEDRGLMREGSLLARWLRDFEARAYRAADRCLIDTAAHADQVARRFGLRRDRLVPVIVGPQFPPAAAPAAAAAGHPITVLFVGTFIPLQGVETILAAARRLAGDPEVRFLLVGSGQTRAAAEDRAREWGLERVEFRDWVDTSGLARLIRSCDVSLGIFGTTPKADRVVPHKVFDACAAGVALITADSTAAREVLTDRANARLVPAGDDAALADAILELKRDPALRERLARGALELARTEFDAERIGVDTLSAMTHI